MVLSVNSIFIPAPVLPGVATQPGVAAVPGAPAFIAGAEGAVAGLVSLIEGRSCYGAWVDQCLVRESRSSGGGPMQLNPEADRWYFMQTIAHVLARVLTAEYLYLHVDENWVRGIFNLFGIDYEPDRWKRAQTDWKDGLSNDERANIKVDDWRYNIIGAVRLYLEGVSEPFGQPEQVIFGLLEKFTTTRELAGMKSALDEIRARYNLEAGARRGSFPALQNAFPDFFADFDATPFRKRAEMLSALSDFLWRVRHERDAFPATRRFLRWLDGEQSSRNFFALAPNQNDPELDPIIESGFALMAEGRWARAGAKFEEVAIVYLNRGRLDEMLAAVSQGDMCHEMRGVREGGGSRYFISSKKIAPFVLAKARSLERKKVLASAARCYRFHSRMLGHSDEDAVKSSKKVGILLERAGDLAGAISAYDMYAHTLVSAKKNREAVGVYRRVARLSREIGDKAGEARASTDMTRALYNLLTDQAKKPPYRMDRRKWKSVAVLYRRSAKLWKEVGDAKNHVQNILNQGVVLLEFGDMSDALEIFKEAFELSWTAGDKIGIAQSLFYTGKVHYLMQNFEIATARLLSARALFNELGMEGGGLLCFAFLTNLEKYIPDI